MDYYILSYHGAPKGESGEGLKSTYNFDKACKVCGTGAKLIGNLKTMGIPKKKIDLFQTYDWDFIISDELYKIILNHKIKIGKLLKIIDFKGNELPYYHLYPTHILPKSENNYGLEIENQCQNCKRNGYFNKVIIGDPKMNIDTYIFPVNLTYNSVNYKLLEKSDIFQTWEWMGSTRINPNNSNEIGFGRPLIVVSGKLKDLLQNLKVKKIMFEKIIFKDT